MEATQLHAVHSEIWTLTRVFLPPKGFALENSSTFWDTSEVVTVPDRLSASMM